VEDYNSKRDIRKWKIEDFFPNAFYIIKGDEIVDCNVSALKVFGYDTKKELIGLKPYELSPERQPDGENSVEKGKKIIAKAYENLRLEFRWLHRRKNGEEFIADIKIYRRGDYLYAIIIDINELEKLRKLLKTKEYTYRLIFDNHKSVMMLIDPKTGHIIDANSAATLYYGYSREELLNMRMQDINILSEEEIKEEIKKVEDKERNYFNFTHRLSNGELRDVEVHSIPIEIDGRKLLFSIISDINSKITELSMFEHMFKKSPNAVAILDSQKRIVNINKKFTELFQYTLEEVKDKNIADLICEKRQVKEIMKKFNSVFSGGIIKCETKRKRKDGMVLDVELLAYPVITNNRIIGVNLVYNDISEKKKKDEEIRKLAETDALTGLYNKLYFKEKLDILITQSNEKLDKFGLLFIDLDNFKEINDTLGHFTGDTILIDFSKRLKRVINKDDLLSRFGGDEFTLLVKRYKTRYDLLALSKKILDMLNKPFIINNNELYLSASIGIAEYPLNGKESNVLIKNADIAMYKAKENIDNEYKIGFYSDDMKAIIEERFTISNYLRKAIENKELSLHYQPIIQIDNNEIIGAEALLRWNNHKLGTVPPNKFIPIAENTGLIHSIGIWVLESVCKQINSWKEKGLKLIPISINISVKQLENRQFTRNIRRILNDYNIDTRYIEFEITESVSAGDMDIIAKTIKELSGIGIKILMDDFGTGYSSLNMLKNLYIDKLKIDKVFIDDIIKNVDDNKMIKAIILMAKTFNLKIVAEGIETQMQLDFLKELGCDFGQGYLFSKPVDSNSFEMLLIGKFKI
jgi:diguanylate cyclase (GGDEF)-like protein/PAS domain S-box-containing protein